jgi:hypothetical protein
LILVYFDTVFPALILECAPSPPHGYSCPRAPLAPLFRNPSCNTRTHTASRKHTDRMWPVMSCRLHPTEVGPTIG